VTSILRFHTFLRTNSFHDATWEAVELIIWTITEPGIYLISACLLSYRPLLDRAAKSRLLAGFVHSSSRGTGYGNGQSVECMGGSGSIPLRKGDKSAKGFTELNDEDSVGTTGTVNLTIAGADVNRPRQP
jgi:hypothetical protein